MATARPSDRVSRSVVKVISRIAAPTMNNCSTCSLRIFWVRKSATAIRTSIRMATAFSTSRARGAIIPVAPPEGRCPRQHLDVAGHRFFVLGIEAVRALEARQRLPIVAAQQVGIAHVIVVLRRPAGQLEQLSVYPVGKIEALQVVVGRGEAEIGLDIARLISTACL